MALHYNGFIAKSHISRRWKFQFIESPESLSVPQQPVMPGKRSVPVENVCEGQPHHATCSAK